MFLAPAEAGATVGEGFAATGPFETTTAADVAATGWVAALATSG